MVPKIIALEARDAGVWHASSRSTGRVRGHGWAPVGTDYNRWAKYGLGTGDRPGAPGHPGRRTLHFSRGLVHDPGENRHAVLPWPGIVAILDEQRASGQRTGLGRNNLPDLPRRSGEGEGRKPGETRPAGARPCRRQG